MHCFCRNPYCLFFLFEIHTLGNKAVRFSHYLIQHKEYWNGKIITTRWFEVLEFHPNLKNFCFKLLDSRFDFGHRKVKRINGEGFARKFGEVFSDVFRELPNWFYYYIPRDLLSLKHQGTSSLILNLLFCVISLLTTVLLLDLQPTGKVSIIFSFLRHNFHWAIYFLLFSLIGGCFDLSWFQVICRNQWILIIFLNTKHHIIMLYDSIMYNRSYL